MKITLQRLEKHAIIQILTNTNMSVAIRCGIKVDGKRKMSKSMCCKPVYKKGKLVKGCELWDECQEELQDGVVDVYEDFATLEEIESGKAFRDIDGVWKIFRKI